MQKTCLIELRVARVRNQWTQKDVADMLGITAQSYNQIESGKLRPSIKIGKKISQILNVPFEYLYFAETRQQNQKQDKS